MSTDCHSCNTCNTCNSCGNEGYYSSDTGCSKCGCSDPCETGCGCEVKLASLTCATHDGLAYDCIDVEPGDNLENIISKINTAICNIAQDLPVGDDGADGQGIDHVSFTSTNAPNGLASQSGFFDTYTMWADTAETVSIGTFIVYNGTDGESIDHVSLTSTTSADCETGQTDTYTVWGDAGATISLGTFDVVQGTGIDHVSYTPVVTIKEDAAGNPVSVLSVAGVAGATDTYTIYGGSCILGTFTVTNPSCCNDELDVTNDVIEGYEIKELPPYLLTAGFGMADLDGQPSPRITVVGRTVKIEGDLLIPLATEGSLTVLIPDASEYYNRHSTSVDVFRGPEGGYIPDNTALQSVAPILPAALLPAENVTITRNQIITRPVRDRLGVGSLLLSTILSSVTLRSDGRLRIGSIAEAEQAGVGDAIKNSPLYQGIISNVLVGDAAIDYSSYRGSFSKGVDKRDIIESSKQYPATFDGSTPSNFGGFRVPISVSYPLPSSVTDEEIIAAVAAI